MKNFTDSHKNTVPVAILCKTRLNKGILSDHSASCLVLPSKMCQNYIYVETFNREWQHLRYFQEQSTLVTEYKDVNILHCLLQETQQTQRRFRGYRGHTVPKDRVFNSHARTTILAGGLPCTCTETEPKNNQQQPPVSHTSLNKINFLKHASQVIFWNIRVILVWTLSDK